MTNDEANRAIECAKDRVGENEYCTPPKVRGAFSNRDYFVTGNYERRIGRWRSATE